MARQIAFPSSRVGGGMTILLFFVVLAVSFVVIEALRRTRNRADRPR
ncbi:hypothetical protein [Catenulispora pinisilvae]|nr:hypothetical protein [Catenulispora pinisilvae]